MSIKRAAEVELLVEHDDVSAVDATVSNENAAPASDAIPLPTK